MFSPFKYDLTPALSLKERVILYKIYSLSLIKDCYKTH
jgi:hypothetical protein